MENEAIVSLVQIQLVYAFFLFTALLDTVLLWDTAEMTLRTELIMSPRAE